MYIILFYIKTPKPLKHPELFAIITNPLKQLS